MNGRPASTLLALLFLPVLLAACGGSSPSTSDTSSDAAVVEVPDCVPTGVGIDALGVHGTSEEDIPTVVQGKGTVGIVFAGMETGDLCQWYSTAAKLASAGYRTAVFDDAMGDYTDEVVDVSKELRRRGATSIVLIGASKGGVAVITAAKRTKAKAVVVISAPDFYENHDALAAMKKVTAPTYFIVGKGDQTFLDTINELHAASPAVVKPLTVIDTSDHGTDMLDASLTSKITKFVADHAPAAAS